MTVETGANIIFSIEVRIPYDSGDGAEGSTAVAVGLDTSGVDTDTNNVVTGVDRSRRGHFNSGDSHLETYEGARRSRSSSLVPSFPTSFEGGGGSELF